MKKKIWFGMAGVVFILGLGMMQQGVQSPNCREIAAVAQSTATDSAMVSTETPAQEENLTWGMKKTTMKAGKVATFQVMADGSAVEPSKIQWSASNDKATIDKNGKVKTLRYGKVMISATYMEETISCKLTIKPKKIIGLDPGHQQYAHSGTEPVGPGSSVRKAKVAGGTCGVSSRVPEYKLTLTIGKKLKKELVDRGYKVVMTRTKHDVNISNKERAEKINDSGADIAIRIHGDGGASSARGACGLYPSPRNPYVGHLSAKSLKLSQCIMDSYCKATGIRNRGNIQRDDLTGTNWSKVPVMLIELGFMTNATEDQYMQSASGQKTMVESIADGIDDYYK